MGKIKLKANLISESENLNIDVLAIRTDNKIIYKENDIQVTITVLDNKLEIKRVSPDYEVDLFFDNKSNTLSTYKFVGGNKTFQLNTITKILRIKKDIIKIEYELEGNKFSYVVETEDL